MLIYTKLTLPVLLLGCAAKNDLSSLWQILAWLPTLLQKTLMPKLTIQIDLAEYPSILKFLKE